MNPSNRIAIIRMSLFSAIANGFTSPFIIPLLLLLGANNIVIGIVAALPHMASIIAQVPGVKIIDFFKKRVNILILFDVVKTITLVSIIAALFIVPQGPIPLILAALFVRYIAGNLAHPSWISLLADIVPKKIRGVFFAKRNAFIEFGAAAAFFSGGFFLDYFIGRKVLGFASLFAIASIFATASVFMFKRIKEPRCRDRDHSLKSALMSHDLKRFIRFVAFFNFAFMIASPFFTVYKLTNLKMSYTLFVASLATAAIAKIASQPRWGKLADKYGDKPVAMVAVLGTALVPLFFLFIRPETFWLVFFAEALSGMAWAGFDIATLNLLLDETDSRKRAVQTAEYSVIVSIPLIIAPIIGGLLAQYAHNAFLIKGISFVFALSFILRASSAAFLLKLREPRAKREYPFKKVLFEVVQFNFIKHAETFVASAVRYLINHHKYKKHH